MVSKHYMLPSIVWCVVQPVHCCLAWQRTVLNKRQFAMSTIPCKKEQFVNKLCGSPSTRSVGAEAPRVAEPTAPDRNVAVGSHGEYVPSVIAAAA